MEIEKHKKRHIELHQKLNELIVDFICYTGALPSKTKLTELMSWSHEQTTNPTEEDKKNGRRNKKKN